MISDIPLRNLAHLGDSVYEVFVREKLVLSIRNIEILHKTTVSFVNAEFQAELLEKIIPLLSEKEFDIVRRARNLQTTTSRKVNHKLHKISTAFEALIGYLYIYDKTRLNEIFGFIDDLIVMS